MVQAGLHQRRRPQLRHVQRCGLSSKVPSSDIPSSDIPSSDILLDRLTRVYGAAADPGRAVPMAAYMREKFPFLGIASPARKVLDREVVAGLPRPGEPDLATIATACWALPEREYQYFACGYLARHARTLTPAFLPTARTLILTRSWWDTVDVLASDVVGEIVLRHPDAVAVMDEWAACDELWLIRTAIIHQLRFKKDTDHRRLFGYCRAQAGHPDFFVRKAIGWALRQYARVEPDAVRGFVEATPALSGLSVREALKHLR